jgi:hypothetical protein
LRVTNPNTVIADAEWRNARALGFAVMTPPGRAPSPLRRAAAAAALAALVAALLDLVISAIFRWYILPVSVISLGVAVVAAWFILSRHGLARALAAVVAAVALVTFIGVVIATGSPYCAHGRARARCRVDRGGQLRAAPDISGHR